MPAIAVNTFLLGKLGFVLPIGVWWICDHRKQRAIGGWLLFFFILMLGGVLSLAITFAGVAYTYLPGPWIDRTMYALFMVSTIPSLLCVLARGSLSIIAMKRPEPGVLNAFKMTFMIEIAAGLLGLGIDLRFFAETIGLSAASELAIPVILLLYFRRSERVKRVFITHDWDVPRRLSITV